jgi:cysteine sulfinate desulfinase/cysteine desulfurase-like protein
MALGMDEQAAREHVRFSFPPNMSDQALQTVIDKVVLVVDRMRTFGKL